ncbi:MAG: helix-turn-helix transcriptional regulator [Actinomycetota bacterium]
MTGQQRIASLLDAAAALAGATDLEAYPSLVLEVLAAVVPNELGAWHEIDPETNRVVASTLPEGVLDAGLYAAFERYVGQNPLYVLFRDEGATGPLRLSDLIASDDLHRLEFYEHVFRPLATEHQIAVGIPSPPPQLIAITLNRGRDDFTDDDLHALTVLQPHLLSGYDRCRTHAGLRREAARLQLAIEAAGLAVLHVADGAVLHVSGRAASLLERAGLEPDDVVHLAGVLDAPGVPVVVGGLQLTALESLDERIVVVEPVSGVPDSHPLLTPREIAVLSTAAEGVTAAGVARRLGISERTVHTHLRNAYRKLGVPNLAAAVSALRRPGLGRRKGR